MSEEQTKQLSSRGKSRRERVEFARSRDILDVANELNMDLVRSGRDYRWKDHDSLVITPSKNLWKWYSRNQGGDVISLVEVMKEVGFNQAIDYLNDGRFKEFTAVEQVREEFSYYLQPYEQPFEAARSYLKDNRGLSDETIDFFLGQGVLAQANAKVNGSIEPVVVFKSVDFSGEIVGATLQGIEENWDKWPERGYAKNIVRNSDGITGMHVDVGQPNRLIFAESAIDLMSYYELHKDNLQDVRLISMDGLKESVIGRHLSQLLLEVSGRPIGKTHEQLAESLQTAIDHDFFSDGKNADLITLAVDNDEGGQNFIQSLQEKGAAVTPDLPMLEPGKEKTDWNDLLQREKTAQESALKEEKEAKPDNSRLAQAERKLERLKGQFDTRANNVYAHTRQANGQPMNDKRNGAAFFRKQEQLEGAVFATLDDIKKQEERVEKLRYQEELKERGFNKQGSGLEMSVQNIPRIKEELEKTERGESFFTRETLKRYRQELVRLEAMRDRLETTRISPGAQQLIDEGLVNQWQKQPTLYFVKGLRKVALELTEEGEFQPSQKYLAKDTEAVEKVSELLDQQASVNNELVQNIELEPGSVSLEQATDPKFELEFSELGMPDQPITNFDELQDWIFQQFDARYAGVGYFKTYLRVHTVDEHGQEVVESIRFDVGKGKNDFDPMIEHVRDYLIKNEYIHGVQLDEQIEHLSTVARKDLPINIQESERLQELLGQVEELGQNAYFWVTEEDIGQPKEVVTQLDNWFSSGKADSTYKSDLFELVVGDYTYMIEFKDGSISLQNMEEYAQYLSSRLEKTGVDTVALELESVIGDFNQMKESITEAMDKELEVITVNRNSLSEETQKPKEKPLEIDQEEDFNSGQNKKERINVSKGSLQPEAEGSAVPVPSDSTFEPAVTSHPTLSSRYLEFTTDSGYVSNVRDGYHVISRKELDKLNNFAPHIQEMARWYRDNLASSDILYVVQNGVETDIVRLTFEEKNFSHLTGIQPVEKNHSAAKTLNDFAEGRGHYNNILLANQDNTFKKLGVLPNLKAVLNPVSFYFDDLEEIKRFKRMDVSRAIKSDDKDILLAFRTVDGTSYPATLLKVKGGVKADIEAVEGKIILGIYRERAGQIEQIAINEEFVKDGGKAMFEVLKNQEYEESGQEITPENTAYVYTQIRQNGEVLQHGGLTSMDHAESVVRSFREDRAIAFVSQKPLTKSEIAQRTAELLAKNPDLERTRPYTLKESFVDVREVRRKRSGNQESEITSEMFTQVLDTVYNVGSPQDLSSVPGEFHAAWNHYFELSEANKGDFKHVIDKAVQEGLVLTESPFYQEWTQDRIYNENYHVRIQQVDNWPDGVQQPFNSGDLRAYEEFVTSLYKGNQGLGDNLKEARKVTFDIYAPGGQLIKDKVSYNMGVETEPVSRLLGLGYRRLEGQSELALIDEAVLSQLEKLEVNQGIAAEANEQGLKVQENLPDEPSPSRENFPSPKQAVKEGLAQKVEEIVAETAPKILVSSIPQIQENLSVEGYLMGISQTGGQMLYTNREDFGQDYQLELAVHSPKAIDFLEDVEAPWTLALMREEKNIGYVAYGGDWAKEFQIEEELEQLAAQIGDGKVPEGLYKQAEVDAFLAHHLGNEKPQTTLPTEVAEPFDYTSASAYDISEHAFQKIREYTQSPENLLEYMDFMSKFPQLSPRNVALIHDQWPGANAVATYDQWKAMGEALGLTPDDVIHTKATYSNKRTGETREVLHQGLSVKTGEKSQITLFRPLMTRMIPVLDENGKQLKNDKGNPKYKKLSEATPQEKALVKEGKLPVKQFQERDRETGQPRFTTYKVFELSQTTLKPESYPKAMPNRHFDFDTDQIKTTEVLEGLCDYAKTIGVTILQDDAHVLGNAKGAFFPGDQLILLNSNNTPGEKIATTIHELAHATLHNPSLKDSYQVGLPRNQKELEAEMTSHLVSKHFGLDTSEKAFDYMAKWTKNLTALDDQQLTQSFKRIHKTVSQLVKHVEAHTKPYQVRKQRGMQPNFSQAPKKGPSR